MAVHYHDIELAMAVHASVLKLEEDSHLVHSLIVSYIRMGLLSHAHKVFLSLPCLSVASCTAIISGLAKSNREHEALELFFGMRNSGINPNEFTFVAILTACNRFLELKLGFQIHGLAIKMGCLSSIFVSNALMGLYGKCGCLEFLLQVFDEMPQRDIVSWNTVISSVVKESLHDSAFELLRDMQRIDGFRVDKFTVSTILAASTASPAAVAGREIHASALKFGIESNLSVKNALIGFYSKCGSLKQVVALYEKMPIKDIFTWTQMITAYMQFGLVDSAVEIFNEMPERNCISCNALLAGFCRNGKASMALDVFCRMVEESMDLDDFTFTSIISACGLTMEVDISEQIHGFTVKLGLCSKDCIEVALIDMYTRCGKMDQAEKLFIQCPDNDNHLKHLTSMICGYSRNGKPEEAISLFHLAQSAERISMDEVLSTAILSVCGTLLFSELGVQIHCHALKEFVFDLTLENAIVSMYSKCGNMNDAVKVFNSMAKRDIVSWNGLISGYLLHRQGAEALAFWFEMEKASIKPDSITFILIISAYKHTKMNLVHNCRKLLTSMKTLYDIEPTSEHYASYISVLGSWGLLEEAEETIIDMPFEPDVSVWRALLDGCRIHLNTKIGRRAAKQILAMDPKDPSTYILVSNLYSISGRWNCSQMVREEMREKGFHKFPGRSWIISQNKVHSFFSRDTSHFQAKDIYSGLDILILECLKAGYEPDTSYVLHEVEENQKRNFLFYHSAKLAVTYGLLMNGSRKPIRVVKNILLCGDCHMFLKYVSIVTRREIFLRDSTGFHHFLNGKCSCKDNW